MPKVSVEHKEAVRRRLLDAARTAVERDGWAGTSTRAILQEAGVSAGTLYNYFSSKEELYEEVAEDILLGDVERLVAGGADARAILRLILTAPGTGVAPLAWFRGRVTDDADTRRAIARLNAWILAAFRPLVTGDDPPDPDVDALIELLDIVWDGMTRRAAMGTFQTGYERVGAVCLRLLGEQQEQ